MKYEKPDLEELELLLEGSFLEMMSTIDRGEEGQDEETDWD